MKPSYPNILIISGNGKNSGKTTLACRIIEKYSRDHEITGIKISPHFHSANPGEKVPAKEKGYFILEENNKHTGKDSSRMLAAGAHEVFYIQTEDPYLNKAFFHTLDLIRKGSLIVCESGALRKFIVPGAFLVLTRESRSGFKPGMEALALHADRIIRFDGEEFDLDLDQIHISDNTWVIRG